MKFCAVCGEYMRDSWKNTICENCIEFSESFLEVKK